MPNGTLCSHSACTFKSYQISILSLISRSSYYIYRYLFPSLTKDGVRLLGSSPFIFQAMSAGHIQVRKKFMMTKSDINQRIINDSLIFHLYASMNKILLD